MSWNLPAQIQADQGNRSAYKPEVLTGILDAISEGCTVIAACRAQGVSYRAFYRWRSENTTVMKATLLAREMCEDSILDECLEIADNQDEPPDSRKVRVWTRLQVIAKWNPERFGDKVRVTHDMQPVLEQLNAARARIIEHQS